MRVARAILKGIPLSPGIAIGPLFFLGGARLYEKRTIEEADVPIEQAYVDAASRKVCASLLKSMENATAEQTEYKAILASQMELARDPKIMDGAKARIKRRKICAAQAISETISELCSLFQGMPDPWLAERAHDIRAIGESLGASLESCPGNPTASARGILAAPDISPSELHNSAFDEIEAILTLEGGTTSHTAIMARSLKIPALAGVSDLFSVARNGETAIVDAATGRVLLSPDAADLEFYSTARKNCANFENEAKESALLPAQSHDGRIISVLANLDHPGQIGELANSGAEGIGLYRTEYSFLGGELPDEETLTREYQEIIRAIAPQKAVFRALDVGADKLLPPQEALREPNPALGLRGIRFCLARRDIFRMQLRAILRASSLEPASIMLPMVSTLHELLEVKNLLGEISLELAHGKIAHSWPLPLGVMVETPAAVMICDALAANCDFLSIGTNDLLHYLMSIDRNNRHVAYLNEPLHPAFIRSLKTVIDSGHKQGVKVSVCGELAADPFGVALLMGLGVDELSAAPRFVPSIKHIIRQLDMVSCAAIARSALNEFNTQKTQASLAEVLAAIPGATLPHGLLPEKS